MSCETCEHQSFCYPDGWEPGAPVHMEVTTGPDLQGYNHVHTCKTCFEKVLTFIGSPHHHTRFIVPDECPRWNVTAGSATECGSCRKEREDLQKAKPGYAASRAATGDMMKTLVARLNSRMEHGKNYEDLDLRRQSKEAISRMVEASIPEFDLESKDLHLLQVVLNHLLKVVWDEPEFIRQRETCEDTWHISEHILDWTHGLLLAAQRHDEPIALAHEWMLVFTDKPMASRMWHRLAIPRRKLAIRNWEMILRTCIEGGFLEACRA